MFLVVFLIWLPVKKSFQTKLLILAQKRENKNWTPGLLVLLLYVLIHNLCQMVSLQLTIPQIKAEMEKTLQWLVPIAANTTK